MIKSLMTAVFGTRFDRERKRLQPVVDLIHAAEERLQALSETELKAQTQLFRERLAERTGAVKQELEQVRAAKHACADPVERDGLEQRFHELEAQFKRELKAGLDEILPEAFATVREAWRRLVGTTVTVTGHEMPWNMVHYDVQLIGGIELHLGKIAEMATGEGKTLVATLPLYLNALAGRGAHLVTVNSYLARRDSQWMGHLYTLPRPHRRLHRRHRAGHARAPRRVPRRHHVRHEQRVRLRLPARQHGGLARPARAARALRTRSSTKWTRSSSTRRARRSSSPAPSATRATSKYRAVQRDRWPSSCACRRTS